MEMQSEWTTTVWGNTLEEVYKAAGEKIKAFFGSQEVSVAYDIRPGTDVTSANSRQPEHSHYIATVTVVW